MSSIEEKTKYIEGVTISIRLLNNSIKKTLSSVLSIENLYFSEKSKKILDDQKFINRFSSWIREIKVCVRKTEIFYLNLLECDCEEMGDNVISEIAIKSLIISDNIDQVLDDWESIYLPTIQKIENLSLGECLDNFEENDDCY